MGTTLCVCSYMNYDTFYDYKNYQVRYDLIKQNFDYLRKLGYSEQLVKVIQSCLSETEDKRTTLEELEDFLNPMDEENGSYDEISQVKVEDLDNRGVQEVHVEANRDIKAYLDNRGVQEIKVEAKRDMRLQS